jgi:hypothetical protein
MSAPATYDSQSYQLNDGLYNPLNVDLALCLTGMYMPPCGACCDDYSGQCEDNVELLDCLYQGKRFQLGTPCVDMRPACGFGTGACCYDDDTCTVTTTYMCATLVGDANCDGVITFDDINPFVAVLSGGTIPGCPAGNCDCNRDGVMDFNDINPFVEIISGGPRVNGMFLGFSTECAQCPCVVVCPPGGTDEGEPCGTDTNGGCNDSPPIFGGISCGETICGTSYFDGENRDTDWLKISGLTGANTFTVTAEAEFDLQLLFITDTGPGNCNITIPYVSVVGPCMPATITTDTLPLGTYYVWVGPQYATTVPCDRLYWVKLECQPAPSGACCRSGVCHDGYTEYACVATNGMYQGDGTLCANATCPQPPPADACNDPRIISALPYDDVDNSCNYLNDYDEVCTYSGSTSPDVAYRFIPDYDMSINVSLCNDDSCYDSKIYIYEGGCPGTLLACNDDFCATACFPYPYVSKVEDVQLYGGNYYYIIVDGYGGACGQYHLTVSEGVPCAE